MTDEAVATLMYVPDATVDLDGDRIALIINMVTSATPEEATEAANLIIDYLIATFQHAGSVRLN